MPADAYAIGINLVANAEGVVGPLDKIIAALKRVQDAQKSAQMGFSEMASGLRGASRTADALASSMERVARFAAEAARATSRIRTPGGFGGGSDRPPSSPGPMPAYTASQQLSASVPLMLAAGGGRGDGLASGGAGGGSGGSTPLLAGPGGSSGGIPLTGGAFVSAAGRSGMRLPTLGPAAKAVGAYASYETLRGAYEEGADVGDIIAKMRAMQVMGPNGQPISAFTGAQIAQAQSQAMATMRRVPGIGYGQGLDVILQTAGLLGSSSKALALAPQLSFNAQVLSRYGKGDAIGQIEKGVQAGELTGLTGADGQINVPRLLDFVNRLTRTTVAMGGQLDIGKYLTGIRQFGLGAESADLDFTTATLPAYMKIMGEAKAGTALTSMQQVLLAPVPKTRATQYQQEQERIGLRDRSGELRNADTLKDNSQDYFVQYLLPALNKAGYRSPAQITEEIQRLLPRQTVDRLAGAGIMDRALIDKEVNRNLAQQRAGDAPLATMLASAPGNQFKAFAENFKALEAVTTDAAMGPSMDVIHRLTASFQNMTDYLKAHPDDVKMFAQDVDSVLKVLLHVAHVTGEVWGLLPAPLKQVVAGAAVGGALGSILPGPGTASGAVVGGALGAMKGFWRWIGPNMPDLPSHPTGLPPAASVQKQSYETQAGAGTMQPITISIVNQMDGRTVAQTLVHHVARLSRPAVLLGTNDPDFLAAPMAAGSRSA